MADWGEPFALRALPDMDIIGTAIGVVVFLAMVVVGLDLTSHDFRQVARRPGLLAGATATQIVLLPALGVALVRGLSLEPELAMALALLAACPGGGISNYYAYLARANTPLSITLTAATSLGAIVTLPLVLGLLPGLLGAQVSFNVPLVPLLGQVLFLLTVPVVLGMGIRHLAPAFARRNSGRFRRLSMVGVAGLVVLVLAKGAGSFSSDWAQAAQVNALFVLASMALGYGVAAAYRLEARDKLTLLIEFGVRNSALPVAMAVMFFHQFDLAVLVTVYFLMQVSLMLLVILVYKSVPAWKLQAAPTGLGQ